MTPHARHRQTRYRERRKQAGYHRLEVWIPQEVWDGIKKRHKEFGEFSRPALAVVALLRRAMRLPRPLEPWERYRSFSAPSRGVENSGNAEPAERSRRECVMAD